jgi:hypothetical protein
VGFLNRRSWVQIPPGSLQKSEVLLRAMSSSGGMLAGCLLPMSFDGLMGFLGLAVVLALVAGALYLWLPHGPSRAVRRQVKEMLAGRPVLSDADWAALVRGSVSMPSAFVAWFRGTISEAFGFDISGAVPSDPLIWGLGLYRATDGDVEMDVDSDVEQAFDVVIPDDRERRRAIKTLGEWAQYYWDHISRQHPGATGERTPRKPFWGRGRSSKSRASSAGNGPV